MFCGKTQVGLDTTAVVAEPPLDEAGPAVDVGETAGLAAGVETVDLAGVERLGQPANASVEQPTSTASRSGRYLIQLPPRLISAALIAFLSHRLRRRPSRGRLPATPTAEGTSSQRSHDLLW